MSNPIFKALALGYAPQQILQFLQSAYPSLSPRIKRARSAGYGFSDILNILNISMGGKPGDVRTEAQIQSDRDKSQGKITKSLLALGAGALGSSVIARGLPSIVQQDALGEKEQQGASLPPISGIPQGGLQHEEASSQTLRPQLASQKQLLQDQPEIQTQSSVENTGSQPPPSIDSVSIIREMGLEPKINNLLKAGNSPQQISAAVVASLTPGQKKWFTEQVRLGKARDMLGMVTDYVSSGRTAQNAPGSNIVTQDMSEPGLGKETQPAKPVKGDFVAAPGNIVGDIADIREKEALVRDENGKLHKVKSDQLISSPIPEQDLASLYDELISGIEKETGEEVSRNVNWAGYDPATNTLAYLPHLGALYVYDDVSPEEREQLTSLLNQRKTTGENFIGAWKEGSKSPIGAAMAAQIKKMQAERGGKGKEYSGKFLTIYDALEPAKKAAKKKYEEMKKKRKK